MSHSKPANKNANNDEPSTKERLLNRNCTKDEFFLLYFKLLKERYPSFTVEFTGESALSIVNADGKKAPAYLDNLWLKYREASEDRSELIEKYIRMVKDLFAPEDPIERDAIVAMVKDLEYVKSTAPEAEMMSEHLCGDLWIVYAVDRPESIVTLGRKSMISAGISETELLNLAVTNLSRILPVVERHGEEPPFRLIAGMGYDASLLLFDPMWDDLADTVDGQIVATVPSRDFLLYTGSSSMDGLKEIREQSRKVARSAPHRISESLIVREDGKWTVFNAI